MVQARESQVSQSENETKLDQVQSRFPNDTLYLAETLDTMEVNTQKIFNPSVVQVLKAAWASRCPALDLYVCMLVCLGCGSFGIYIFLFWLVC